MKRYILIVIIITTLLLSSCTYMQSYPTPTYLPTVPPVQSSSSEQNAAKEDTTAFDAIDSSSFDLPMTLVEDDDLSVVLKSVEAANSLYIVMLFEVENKTNHSYQLHTDGLSINNFMMYEYNNSFEISQNSVEECTLKIEYETLQSTYGIENIIDISFYYSIADMDEYETKYKNTVYLSNDIEQEHKDLTTDYLIGSDEYLDIYFVDSYKEDSMEYYEIVIYNKSDIALGVTAASIAINGVSIVPYLSDIIMAESYYLFKGTVSTKETSFLTEYDYAASIQMELRAYSMEDLSILSTITEKLILDENIKIEKEAIKGQIVYDKDDVLLSVEKIIEEENIQRLKLYLENNSNETVYVSIPNVQLNDQNIDQYTYFSVLPNTYSTQIIDLGDTMPNEEYEMIMECSFQLDFGGQYQEDTLEFTLEK